MNPISHSLYWSANKLGLWIPTKPPEWVVKAMESSEGLVYKKIFGKRKRMVQYYRGKTFIYKIVYRFELGEFQGDSHIDFTCEKRLLNTK